MTLDSQIEDIATDVFSLSVRGSIGLGKFNGACHEARSQVYYDEMKDESEDSRARLLNRLDEDRLSLSSAGV